MQGVTMQVERDRYISNWPRPPLYTARSTFKILKSSPLVELVSSMYVACKYLNALRLHFPLQYGACFSHHLP